MTDVTITGNLAVQGNVSISTSINISCAILSDVKSTNTAGGSSSTGWNDRTLNTLLDPNGIITLDSGNVLFNFEETGNYYVEAVATAHRSSDHQLCLTDSSNTVKIKGLSTNNENAANKQTNKSYLQGLLTVTSTGTDYKLRHYITSGFATTGFGLATNVSGIDEVYAILSVLKISS